MYEYKAKATRVVDGDTVYLEVDMGFYIKVTMSFRLLGINAPEMQTATYEAGVAAKTYLESLVMGKALITQTTKPDKYGRWLATIFVDGMNVNEAMIAAGHAVAYMT